MDAIDNSAGVDCSDHEVNIKILLDTIVADGDLTGKQRNAILAEMADEVAALVLRDNYEQTQAISSSTAQAVSMIEVHERYVRSLEQDGTLNRELEVLPTDEGFDERQAAGGGLTAPKSRPSSHTPRSRSDRNCSPPTCRRNPTSRVSSNATFRCASARSSRLSFSATH